MAFIKYVSPDQISPESRVADRDNIIQIHGVHDRVLRHHYDLYVELMHKPGPLARRQREMIAVMVSAINECGY